MRLLMFRIIITLIFMSTLLITLNSCSKKDYNLNPWTTVLELVIKENKHGMDNK